ncbi:conserved hypothetical protein [Solidesulfovibrio fructosivorans JJ]]|uniref:YfhO family protein n=1 Tax=Solidesulfovibrio fructosivorans JJ] TaxID=596151 RepID=E1JY72_SOLFR|nr:hypothetical protein [Solidesulfovibrio fructosivorans]EFL50646.1 conserved hypothetical protein [Solidesulfovibrio fructosivorans JJ]]
MKRRWALLAAVALVALFALLSWRGILLAPGQVYQNWDNSIPPYPQEIERYGAISKHAWYPHYDLGSPGAFSGITRWFDLLMRDGIAPLGGPIIAKWQGPVYAVIGGGGILALARVLGLGFWPGLVAALLYAFNPRQYSLAVSGHIEETGFALALLPWVLLLLHRALGQRSLRRLCGLSLAAGLLGALVCSASPFGIVFYGAFTGLFTVAAMLARRSLKPLAVFVVAGLAVVVLHMQWVVPAAHSMLHGVDFKHHQTESEIRDNYEGIYRHFSTPPRQAMIGHTDNYGMGTEYAYPVNFKDTPVWVAAAFGLLFIALAGLAYRPRDKVFQYFAGLCLLSGFVLMTGHKTLAGAVFYERFLHRVPMLFFQMARPARWLPLYYAGLSLLVGMGLAAIGRRSFWRGNRTVDGAAGLFAAACLAVYLAPYWNGSLAIPKNATTQTMALMPQPVSPAEGTLSRALSDDPADYRITVWPTIAGPTGDVPAPPHDAVTRNFGMLGKDAVMGPTFIGEPYSRFLLTVLMRSWPYTDRFGRLLGLAAVKRVIFDPSVPYLSYGPFGWMPTTKRGPETLFDPGDILAPFVAAQADLSPDAELAAPPLDVLRNTDFLPRLRLAGRGVLAAGGFPLLLSESVAAKPDFPGRLAFFGSDLTQADVARLDGKLAGVATLGRSWPELLLPYLPANAFVPASAARLEGKFGNLSGKVLDDPRLGGAELDGGGKVSDGPGRLEFPLVGHGSWRIFVRAGAAPFAGRAAIRLDGAPVAGLDAGMLGKGLDWIDCGTADFEPGPPHGLTIDVPGRGLVVSGLLAVPEDAFDAARSRMGAVASAGETRLAVEAEEATREPALPMQPRLSLPLLAPQAGIAMTAENARLDKRDPQGGGTVAVEGEAPGTVAFTVTFPTPVANLTLEAYPRLFGDKAAPSYVRATVSVDGGPFKPLFAVEGKPDGRWEDVYSRREVRAIKGPARTVTVRFAMRQAQLSSQANSPNHPMRLVAETPIPGGATLSFGAAARLPAVFDLAAPVPGTYAADLRLVGRAGDAVTLPDGSSRTFAADGVLDVADIPVTTDAAGRARLAIGGPAEAACDRIELVKDRRAPPKGSDPPYRRINAGRYALDVPAGEGGYLVFAEAFHPGWRLHVNGHDIAPIRGLGFANAYPLPPGVSGPAELVFRDEAVMARLVPVAEAAWAVLAALTAVLLVPWPRKSPHTGRGHD